MRWPCLDLSHLVTVSPVSVTVVINLFGKVRIEPESDPQEELDA